MGQKSITLIDFCPIFTKILQKNFIILYPKEHKIMYYKIKAINGIYINRIWIANWDYKSTIREVMPNTNVSVLIQLGNCTKYKTIDEDFLRNNATEFWNWYNKVAKESNYLGKSVIIGPHRDLIVEMSEGDTKMICVEFKTGYSNNFFGIPLNILSNNILPLDNANNLLSNITQNIDTDNNETILTSVLEYIETNVLKSPYTNIKDLKLMECIKAIEDNPFVQNVNQLSGIYGTSRRNFNRKVNEYTGFSAQQFIMTQRVNMMKSFMVKHLDYSLNKIIHLCNYHDQSHLNRDTKLIGGLTAIQMYRNIHGNISHMPSPLSMNIMDDKCCGLHLH